MKIKLSLTMLLLTMIVLGLFGACAKEAVPEEPKEEIVLGLLDDYSGPLAGISGMRRDGFADVTRYINEEKGGILGHPLSLLVLDYKMDSALAMSSWERLQSIGVPLVYSYSAIAAAILWELPEKDNIPLLTIAGNLDQLFPKEPTFYFASSPEMVGLIPLVFDDAEQYWADRGETGAPKLGFDLITVGVFPTMWTKAIRMEAEKRGVEYTITRTPTAPIEVTTQVLQMKEFGIDYLGLLAGEAGQIAWLKELKRQGLQVPITGAYSMGSDEIWRAVGSDAIGTRTLQVNPQWSDADLPMVQLVHEVNAKWHPEITWHAGEYLHAFADGLVVEQAIKVAIENAGYDNFDGDAMKEAMETIRDFDVGMGIGYTWTPNDHQGIHGVRIYERAEDGKLALARDWIINKPLPEEQKVLAWWLSD